MTRLWWPWIPLAYGWTYQGSSWEIPRALKVIGSDVLVTGETRGALEGFENQGDIDIFVMKFNSSGHKVWQTQRGCTSHDHALTLAVDSQKNVILAGYTGGSLDGNVHQGVDDFFVMKLDPNGAWLWTHQRGTRFSDGICCLQVTSQDELLLAGYTKGVLDGNDNHGDADIFMMMLDSEGQWQWTQERGSTGYDYVTAFELDSAGAYLLAGFTDGALDGHFPNGGDDLFVMKLDSGGHRWTEQRGTRYEDRALALQVDETAVYVAGYTKGSLDGNLNHGDADLFVMKLDLLGHHQWTLQRGSEETDVATGLRQISGSLVLVGYTQGTMGDESMGMDDILVESFDPNGTHLWTRQTGSYNSDRATAIGIDQEAFLVGYVGRQSQLFISQLSTLPEISAARRWACGLCGLGLLLT